MITKLISFSYPTSVNAKKANLYKSGCYSVETVNTKPERQKPEFVKGFSTLKEAIRFSNSLPYFTDKWCITKTTLSEN